VTARKESRDIARNDLAMVSSEVQRTLVKSPPELWAELSDPETLARHLGELGEIRITRTKPEERVEWEAGSTSGTVVIKPSGWGTKVTLSVTRDIEVVAEPTEKPLPESASTEEAAAEGGPTAEEPHIQDPVALIPAKELDATVEEAHIQGPVALAAGSPERTETQEPDTVPNQAEQADITLEQKPRRGFFARLFARRKPKHSEETASPVADTGLEQPASPEPPDETMPAKVDAEAQVAANTAAQPSAQTDDEQTPAAPPSSAEITQAQAPATGEEKQPEPAPEPPSEPAADLSAELQKAEEVAAEEVKAVLTAVLDRLGAAHHRPFSRS
jgi:hypothetical protein